MNPTTITLLFLLFAVVMFVFEKIPLGVTSMIGIAAKSGYSRSRLLMPLVFAAAMGGNLSLIGAPGNLIAQSALEEMNLSFGFFEYAIVGMTILICGILFYATVGYRFLPNKKVSGDGGTLSLASALSQTGAGAMIAETVMGALGESPSPYVLTFVVFILCCIMTNFMSNTATTALMVPICLSIAQGMGADPRAVLMACVIGGSCAYATPIGMPANTMVVGAGGYTFMDYVKSGLPLIVIATIVSMVILPIAFPFFP